MIIRRLDIIGVGLGFRGGRQNSLQCMGTVQHDAQLITRCSVGYSGSSTLSYVGFCMHCWR